VIESPGEAAGDDADVVALTPRRDPESLYVTLAPAVLGYLRGLAVPEPDDVLGEVFVQVVRDLHRFSGDDAALRRWVFTIAHHRAIDAHRHRRRRPVEPRHDLHDAHVIDDVDTFVDDDLVRAMARLTEDQRQVIALRFVADLSIDEVARVLGRRPGAVKSLQHRALDRLAELLET
jgi:RNA polymerase sigma factor (sigma-70 family)